MRFPRLLLALAIAAVPAWAQEPPRPAGAHSPLITVDGRVIGAAEYEQTLATAVRNKFYHRTPPEAELAAFRWEMANSMVDLILVSTEAKRRGMVPDAARIDRDLERLEARVRNSPGWEQHREAQLARWRSELEERVLAEDLEKRVRSEVSPSPEDVRKFYDANPLLFTQPERVRAWVILLRVEPSAGKAARDAAREEAAAIRARLVKGADFAELAKIHSGDATAANGGDMGYVHRGALPEPMQAILDKLEGDAVSEPIDVLEGIALLKVTDRRPAELRPYDAVTDRARELLRRRSADETWNAFVARLRAGAKIEIDTARLPPPTAARADGKSPAAAQ